MSKRRHVFISHHHADDASVDSMTKMLGRQGYEIRNSSIRAKPANQERLDRGLVKPETIRRLLRMKMSWASTVVVIIGKQTHSRDWVAWEIEQAFKKGKKIVGVFERRGTNHEIPQALKDYATTIVNWSSDSIISAVEGADNTFKTPDGDIAPPIHSPITSRC